MSARSSSTASPSSIDEAQLLDRHLAPASCPIARIIPSSRLNTDLVHTQVDYATGYLGACASQDFDIKAATPWTLHCAAVSSCRWHARRRGDELAVCGGGRLAALTHFVATRLLGKCQLPWEAYMTWFARAPGDVVVTPSGIDHVPCGGVEPWRPPDRRREALVSAVWNRTLVAFFGR